MDGVVCDQVLPPKWHNSNSSSSSVVFKYRPDDEYQLYPDYEITYLKVSCTITGYQPLEDEIQGHIDWDGVDVTTLEGVTELLSSYYPCTDAILQVVVGPSDQREGHPLGLNPFFMDFEPKKRELYEMATDTKERQSRSIESLTLGKLAGTTKSLEVLDIDMGGSTSLGEQGSVAGTGGGCTLSSSNQGQWGKKSVNTQDSQTTRNTEMGTEGRETQSCIMQLSQIYCLLDSYHVETNRAVFFMQPQPQPHVLEEPTGLVRGPRKVEGIQDSFLVVAAPKDHRDYCVSARLDTAHLAETDILDYETRSDVTDLASASAHVPTRHDTPVGTTTREACVPYVGPCWDVTYLCYHTHDVDDAVYNAPTGFDITGFVNVVNQIHSHGSTGVTISPDRKVLTVHAKADSYICFEDSGVCVDCPDEVDKWTRWAGRQVQVQLWSTEPTRKVGTRASLLITTRALCCCDRLISPPEGGIYVAELPRELAVLPVQQAFATLAAGLEATIPSAPIGEQPQLNETVRSATYAAAQKPAGFCSCGGDRAAGQTTMPASTHGMAAVPSLRRANAISDVVRAELTKCITTAELRPWSSSFVDTNLFARQLEGIMSRTRCGRKQLTDQAEMPLKLARVLAARLNRQPEELTRRDVLRYQAEDLARESGMSVEEIRRVNLAALGVRVQQRRPKTGGEKARGKGAQDAQE